jgi:hypothetical protein
LILRCLAVPSVVRKGEKLALVAEAFLRCGHMCYL